MRKNILSPFKAFSFKTIGLVALACCPVILSACKSQVTKSPVSTAEVVNEQPQPAAPTTTPEPAKASTPKAPRWAAKKYAYNPSRTLHWDLLHTKIDISFNWEKKQAPAVATLKLTPWFYSQDSLYLDAVGFDINSIKVLKGRKKHKVSFSYDSTVLAIKLDSTYKKGQILTVEIDYVAKPESVKEKGSSAITSDKGLYFINADGKDPEKPKQIWTQGETQASSHWFPTVDSPNERCTQEIAITVDTAYLTLSNGLLTYSTLNRNGTRTDVWELKQPHAPYLFMMAVGKFNITKDKWRNKDVWYYVEPKYAAKTRNIFGRTPQMMEYFSQKLGVDYPWPKYHSIIVRDYVSGAMENTSASLFMEALQTNDKVADGDNWDDIVAHELFHQWFGDLVTIESWPNLPLNESFATFGELLWEEKLNGTDGLDYLRIKKLQEYLGESVTKQEPLIRYYVRDKEDMFDTHSYAKGGLILQALRQQVGEAAFFAALKLYLTRHQYKSVEIHDLRIAFEEVTGQDLNWFFNQWFMSAGHPKLAVQHNTKGNHVILQVTQQQDTLYTPLFRLPVSIEFVLGNGQKVSRKIVVSKAEQEFEFTLPGTVSNVLFDADYSFPGLVAHNKTTDEYVAQYNSMPRLRYRLDAIRFLKKELDKPSAKATVVAALKDPFFSVRELAVGILMEDSALRVQNKAMLIEMARKDPSKMVQAEILGRLNPKLADEEALLRNAVKDPSPMISSHAAKALLDQDGETGAKLAAEFKTSTNPEIQLIVLDKLADAANPADFDFMVNTVAGLKESNKFFGMMAVGKYFLKCTTCQPKGIELLTKQCKEGDMVSRLAAFRALAMLDEQPGVHETLLEIKNKETDNRLKEYFNLMMGE